MSGQGTKKKKMALSKYKIKCSKCKQFVYDNEALQGWRGPRCRDVVKCNNNIKKSLKESKIPLCTIIEEKEKVINFILFLMEKYDLDGIDPTRIG